MLVPLDGSAFSEAVLPSAAALVTPETEVVLVTVVRESGARTTWATTHDYLGETKARVDPIIGGTMPLPSARPPGRLVEAPLQAEERARVEAQEYLERIARRYFAGRARVAVLYGGDPAQELLELVRKEKPDLVAMATHGRTGLAEMVLGSVTHKLLGAGLAPMLLVRPNGLPAGRGF